MYGESESDAPAVAAESFSLADPSFDDAATEESPVFSSSAARLCRRRCRASSAVSRTTRLSSLLAVSRASRHSSLAMAPRASAASWRTIPCSPSSRRVALRAATAPVARIWPSANATSCLNRALGSSLRLSSRAATDASPPTLRRLKSARKRRGRGSDWSRSSPRSAATLIGSEAEGGEGWGGRPRREKRVRRRDPDAARARGRRRAGRRGARATAAGARREDAAAVVEAEASGTSSAAAGCENCTKTRVLLPHV